MTAATGNDGLERSVTRKVAFRLIPLLVILYFVNYLDRVNIGFAGPNGMNRDLGLTATMFGLAAGIFFVGYLLLEVPSNIALNRYGGRRWLARIMVTWGIVSTAVAFVPNVGTLIVLRFLLGVAEAGFFPGIIVYLTYWFPAAQRARATALFMAAVPVSTAVGSTVSSLVIAWGDGVLGLAGWRFMFLVEGLPAVALGIVTWFYLTDRPRQAAWLRSDEKEWLERTIEQERSAVGHTGHGSLRKALTDPRVLALAVVYFAVTYGLYAVGFFLPSIVAGFHDQYGTDFGVIERGLITAAPYVVAALVMIPWARHADRTRERVWHVAIPAAVGAVATPLALYMTNPFLVMVAVTLCACAVMCAMPVFWALPPTFLTGVAAAGGIALINSLGNLSGFGGPYITGWVTDLTGSAKLALWIVGAMFLVATVTVVVVGRRSRTTRAGDHPGGSSTSAADPSSLVPTPPETAPTLPGTTAALDAEKRTS